MRVEWYYDFISPFAYLASQRLHRLPQTVELVYRPVLFAGLLKAHQHKGPAEIPGKRVFTYRHVQWTAGREGVALCFPERHPFNPLPYLRLSIALGNSPDAVDRIFRFVWQSGQALDDPLVFERLCAELEVADGASVIAGAPVKEALRTNTDTAIEAGVFGVPTWRVDGEVFWGFDALEFLLDYLRDPGLLDASAMRRASETRVGVQRR